MLQLPENLIATVAVHDHFLPWLDDDLAFRMGSAHIPESLGTDAIIKLGFHIANRITAFHVNGERFPRLRAAISTGHAVDG